MKLKNSLIAVLSFVLMTQATVPSFAQGESVSERNVLTEFSEKLNNGDLTTDESVFEYLRNLSIEDKVVILAEMRRRTENDLQILKTAKEDVRFGRVVQNLLFIGGLQSGAVLGMLGLLRMAHGPVPAQKAPSFRKGVTVLSLATAFFVGSLAYNSYRIHMKVEDVNELETNLQRQNAMIQQAVTNLENRL